MTRLFPPAMSTRVVVVVGAESTGKTTLAQGLVEHLRLQGEDAVMVPEQLRLFCDRELRTPLQHEQALIAQQQTDAIAQAARAHDWVVADTSALMTAVYSEMVFGDVSLYDRALHDHASAPALNGAPVLTLLTALDLPWVADGLQRDGPHVREPVDALIRRSLLHAQLPFAVVHGQGPARLDNAWQAVMHHWQERPAPGSRPQWRWVCDKCDDGDCELHR